MGGNALLLPGKTPRKTADSGGQQQTIVRVMTPEMDIGGCERTACTGLKIL
jgi:hypothetical protein